MPQNERIKKGAICKIISDKDSPSWNEEWWKKSKEKKLTFIKKSDYLSPSFLVITNNLVVTVYFSSTIASYIVEQKEVADRYRDFFNVMWKN